MLDALHVRTHALRDRLHDLAVDGVDARAGRKLQEAVDRGALDRRQVVQARQQQPAQQDRRADESQDEQAPPLAAVGDSDDAAREPVGRSP